MDDEKAKLSTGKFVLFVPKVDIEDEQLSTIDKFDQRDTLFYDEVIRLYMKLDLPSAEFQEQHLDQLKINVDVKVSDLSTAPSDATSVTLGDDSESLSRRSSGAQSKSFDIANQVVTRNDLISYKAGVAVWATTITVHHPRARLVKPIIRFTVVASLDRSDSTVQIDDTVRPSRQAQFLTSIEPVWGVNYFGSLDKKYNPGLKNANEFAVKSLPWDVTSIPVDDQDHKNNTDNAFSSQSKDSQGLDNVDDDKIIATLTVPVQSAMNLRIITSKPRGKHDDLVIQLELSVSDLSKFSISLREIIIALVDGSASLLGPLQFPLSISPGECVLFSYHLALTDVPLGHTRKKALSMIIKSKPIIANQLGPLVTANWDTIMDFDSEHTVPNTGPATATLNAPINGYYSGAVGPTGTPNIYEPLKSPTGDGKRAYSKPGRAGSTTSLTTQSSSFKAPLSGISVSFYGSSSVKVGQQFSWKVFAVNKSPIAKSLSLYFHGRDAHQSYYFQENLLSPAATHNNRIQVERSILRKASNISSLPDVGLISLVNDVRVGPIPPMGCFEAEIKLYALSEGIHTLEGVIIVDLATGEGHECERLLDVVVNH